MTLDELRAGPNFSRDQIRSWKAPLSNGRVATLARELREIKGAKVLIADYGPSEGHSRRRKRACASSRFEPKDRCPDFFANRTGPAAAIVSL